MFKYICLLALITIQSLFGNWDNYQGEQIVLFSLAPGIGDEYRQACEEQLLPTYFQKIANDFPDKQVKIIAIEPRYAQDPQSEMYAFLNEWEKEAGGEEKPVIFRKNNIEIQCFNESIPETDEDCSEYNERVENYFLKVLENGGIIFIGNHGQAYGAFEPFAIAHNKLKGDKVHMYICCADSPPFSTPKVYGSKLYNYEELSKLCNYLLPCFYHFF